jgi:arsenite methyltransferase
MPDPNTPLPPALRRVLELLADPPTKPDVSKGYLDLLGAQQVEDAAVPKNTSAIQAVFSSPVGSMLYDNALALSRWLLTAMQQPTEWLNVPASGIALDVGCGPGSVTASLGRAADPDGFALGRRYLRADAGTCGACRGGTADWLPAGRRATASPARVLRPGGRLAVIVGCGGHRRPSPAETDITHRARYQMRGSKT